LKKTKKNRTTGHSVASIHGAVLALVACVLSVPYDMPRYISKVSNLSSVVCVLIYSPLLMEGYCALTFG